MTLKQLVEEAKLMLANAKDSAADHRLQAAGRQLARALIALEGEAFPCGWPKPSAATIGATKPPVRVVLWPLGGPQAIAMTPDEARAIGVAIIHAADEAGQ